VALWLVARRSRPAAAPCLTSLRGPAGRAGAAGYPGGGGGAFPGSGGAFGGGTAAAGAARGRASDGGWGEGQDGGGGCGGGGSLSCFVEVVFRGRRQRSTSVDSNAPMWNEQVRGWLVTHVWLRPRLQPRLWPWLRPWRGG
jgi:hypothetical protein